MKLIISGTRTITDYNILLTAIERYITEPIKELYFGDAKGIDALAKRYAIEHNIPHEEWEADWEKYGKAAGPVRNEEMARDSNADTLLAIWDGKSRGTMNMIQIMNRMKKRVFIYYLEENKL